MAIDINIMSINVNGINDWFDYAEILQELADEVTAFRQNYRDRLETKEKEDLKNYAALIRENAREIATKAAIEKLESLDTELTKLKGAIKNIDGFLTEVSNKKQVISGLAEVVGITTNILSLIP